MLKKRLIADYEIEFDLYGLICTIKDYRLAWTINETLGFHFVKQEDIVINFVDGRKVTITNFLYQTEYSTVRLLKNKDVEHHGLEKYFLIPELSKFDYLIQVHGADQLMSSNQLIQQVKNIHEIDYITRIDVHRLKSRENLIFE